MTRWNGEDLQKTLEKIGRDGRFPLNGERVFELLKGPHNLIKLRVWDKGYVRNIVS